MLTVTTSSVELIEDAEELLLELRSLKYPEDEEDNSEVLASIFPEYSRSICSTRCRIGESTTVRKNSSSCSLRSAENTLLGLYPTTLDMSALGLKEFSINTHPDVLEL